MPDLQSSSIAEAEGPTMLHYDADFDRVSEVIEQPAELVLPAGTVS